MSELLFTGTAQKAITNTVTETSMVPTGLGSTIFPARFWEAGRTVKIKFSGSIAAAATPTARAKLKIGSTTLLDTTALTLPAITGTCDLRGEITIVCRSKYDDLDRTGGSLMADMDVWFAINSAGSTDNTLVCPPVLTSSFDTTASGQMDITWQWGTAASGNSVLVNLFTMEILR